MAEASFDIVSSVDLQEVKNAIAQAMKEIKTRFDLKGSGSDIALTGEEITLTSSDEFKLKAVRDVLESRLVKRQRAARRRSATARSRRRWAARSARRSRCRRASLGEGARDRQGHQGHEAQGAGRHPGRPGAGHAARTGTTSSPSSGC